MEIFKEDRESPYAQAFYRLIALANNIEMEIKQALKPYSLTHAQLNVLYILAKNAPEKLHSTDIKKHLIVSNPDVTRLIDRLVRKGWVKREICPENRRKIDISITSEGKALFTKAHYSAKSATGSFFDSRISREEAIQLKEIFKKIKA